jgi:hypothetical protein
MRNVVTIYIIFVFLWIVSCGPSTSYYPSYEETIAKYSPSGQFRAVRLTDPGAYPDSRYCDCPRVWYGGHWVYYYHGRWIYWFDECWYFYPYFYIYYYDGFPYVYTGHGHSITKGPPPRSIHSAPPPKGAVKKPKPIDRRGKRD